MQQACSVKLYTYTEAASTLAKYMELEMEERHHGPYLDLLSILEVDP